MILSLAFLFSLIHYNKTATPVSQHQTARAREFRQSRKQFPFHGRVALCSPRMSLAKLTPILAFWFPIAAVLSRSLLVSNLRSICSTQPHTTPPLPVPVSPLPSLSFSPCCPSPASPVPSLFPSAGLVLMSPLTKIWLFLPNFFRYPSPASCPLLLWCQWLAFPKLAGSSPPCTSSHVYSAGDSSALCAWWFAGERRQGLAPGNEMSSRPDWVFLGSHGKPQGWRCLYPFLLLSLHQRLWA